MLDCVYRFMIVLYMNAFIFSSLAMFGSSLAKQ